MSRNVETDPNEMDGDTQCLHLRMMTRMRCNQCRREAIQNGQKNVRHMKWKYLGTIETHNRKKAKITNLKRRIHARLVLNSKKKEWVRSESLMCLSEEKFLFEEEI